MLTRKEQQLCENIEMRVFASMTPEQQAILEREWRNGVVEIFTENGWAVLDTNTASKKSFAMRITDAASVSEEVIESQISVNAYNEYIFTHPRLQTTAFAYAATRYAYFRGFRFSGCDELVGVFDVIKYGTPLTVVMAVV